MSSGYDLRIKIAHYLIEKLADSVPKAEAPQRQRTPTEVGSTAATNFLEGSGASDFIANAAKRRRTTSGGQEIKPFA